jgi:hypothetical protein
MDKERTDYTTYIIGGFIGAVVGVVAAYLIANSPDLENGGKPLNSKRLSRLGLGTISVLWGLINPGSKPRN